MFVCKKQKCIQLYFVEEEIIYVDEYFSFHSLFYFRDICFEYTERKSHQSADLYFASCVHYLSRTCSPYIDKRKMIFHNLLKQIYRCFIVTKLLWYFAKKERPTNLFLLTHQLINHNTNTIDYNLF